MAKTSVLTAARLREVLHYNPDTGEFHWIAGGRGKKQGMTAGTVNKISSRYSRVHIDVDGKKYKAHRLAWLYMTGELPQSEIDHINRNPIDNRWLNLRLASRLQNMNNHGLFCTNKTGTNGVSWDKVRMKWIVMLHGKNLGRYDTVEEATHCALLHRKGFEEKWDKQLKRKMGDQC